MNRSDIEAEVQAILHREIDSVTWARWFELADSAVSTVLRVPDLEVTANLTVASGGVALPADFVAVRNVRNSKGELWGFATPASYDGLIRDHGSAEGFYTIRAARLEADPDGTYGVTYWRKVTPMPLGVSENEVASTWPDLYVLYLEYRGLLLERDGPAAGQFLGLWNAAVETVNGGAMAARFGGP